MLKDNKSPGSSGIATKAIKHRGDNKEHISILGSLVKKIWQKEETPKIEQKLLYQIHQKGIATNCKITEE